MGRHTQYPYEGGTVSARELWDSKKITAFGVGAIELRLKKGCDTLAKIMAYDGKAKSLAATRKHRASGKEYKFIIPPTRYPR